MAEADPYWRKVDALLASATRAADAADRKRLIDEALVWRGKALEIERAKARRAGQPIIPLPDDPSEPDQSDPEEK